MYVCITLSPIKLLSKNLLNYDNLSESEIGSKQLGRNLSKQQKFKIFYLKVLMKNIYSIKISYYGIQNWHMFFLELFRGGKYSEEETTDYGPNVSTTPITAMGCRQYLPLSVV